MALSSLALPSGAVHRKARFLAVVPLLASCEVFTAGDTGPPTGVGAFYGTLAALGLVVVVLVVGGELVRRLRRYRFGGARPGAWFVGSLLVVTGLVAAGAAVATVGYLAVGGVIGFDTRNDEECFLQIVVPFGAGSVVVLMALATLFIGTGAALLTSRRWALPVAVAILLALAVAGGLAGLDVAEGVGLVAGALPASVALLGMVGERLVSSRSNR